MASLGQPPLSANLRHRLLSSAPPLSGDLRQRQFSAPPSSDFRRQFPLNRKPFSSVRLPIRASAAAAAPQHISVTFAPHIDATPSSDSPKHITKIVVVGGGTAGWMAASFLAKALRQTASVTVLQAPEISSLGVGEATVPDLQSGFFDFLGIPESEWMPECNASFKTAVKYINWRTPGAASAVPRRCAADGARNLHNYDYHYNLFAPLPRHHGIPLSQYWVKEVLDKSTPPPPPYMYACYATAPALDAKLSPRFLDGTPAMLAAWHFDAHLVADFLRRHATAKLGVRHIQEKMISVELDPNRPDHIRTIHTDSGTRIDADLFIDCTGFRGLLINGVLNEPFLKVDNLLCDSAVATQVPHDDAANGVEPYTSAIAMDSGWTWKIPMLGRFGTGYVYSSEYVSEEKATEDFLKLWGLDGAKTKLNKLKFRAGRNRRAWVGNVVAIGASSCFLEPLESTGILFIYTALHYLLQSLPDMDFREGCATRFNDDIHKFFVEMQDFIQLHFCYSPRDDTPFWRESARLEAKLSQRGRKLMEVYKAGLLMFPNERHSLFQDGNYEATSVFLNAHFYNVIAGLGLLPDSPDPRLRHMPDAVSSSGEAFQKVRRQQAQLLQNLPSMYDYLRHLHGSKSPTFRA